MYRRVEVLRGSWLVPGDRYISESTLGTSLFVTMPSPCTKSRLTNVNVLKNSTSRYPLITRHPPRSTQAAFSILTSLLSIVFKAEFELALVIESAGFEVPSIQTISAISLRS